MARHLHRLLAKEAITEALLSYARSVDRLDFDGVRAVFHEDSVVDYGTMFRGSGPGFVDFLAEVQPPMVTHTHHLSNIAISVHTAEPGSTIDRAGSEAYVMVRSRILAEDGRPLELIAHARYVDRWERRDGTWRVSDRRYLHSVDELWPTRTVLYPVAGARDRTDPAYDVHTRGG